mmetsp:Transcript_38554/g.120415  ORF Transcript_38554/g.120415 Transcript_38554/m.120415 type:complete len:248 (-) Transcript_38554:659-1402(-)
MLDEARQVRDRGHWRTWLRPIHRVNHAKCPILCAGLLLTSVVVILRHQGVLSLAVLKKPLGGHVREPVVVVRRGLVELAQVRHGNDLLVLHVPEASHLPGLRLEDGGVRAQVAEQRALVAGVLDESDKLLQHRRGVGELEVRCERRQTVVIEPLPKDVGVERAGDGGPRLPHVLLEEACGQVAVRASRGARRELLADVKEAILLQLLERSDHLRVQRAVARLPCGPPDVVDRPEVHLRRDVQQLENL